MKLASYLQIVHVLRIMLDETDKKLLNLLQKNAQMTAQELAEALGLSASQCSRRRARLESDGYVRTTRAMLDPEQIGLLVQAFVQITMASHTRQNALDFERLIRVTPQVTGAWTLTGEADYLLRLYCEDLSDLNRIVQEVLLPHVAVSRVHSQIVMETLKTDAPLPL